MTVDEKPRPPLSTGIIVLRLGAIGVVLLGSAATFAYTGGWFSPERITPKKLVAGFEAANGPHPGFRRNHAKGVCATGWFESNGAGAALSKATLFTSGRVPVVARIAFAGGLPYVPDATGTPRSLALRFLPSNGQEWRTGMLNIPVFPLTSTQEFYEQAQASAPDPATGKPNPAKVQAFVAAHPGVAAAGALIGKRAVSSGFADASYNGIHTFRFVAADGAVTPVRWSAVAVDPFVAAAPAAAPAAGSAAPTPNPNGMFEAYIARTGLRPVQWRLVVTLGKPGETTNPSLPWPADLRQVDVGAITLDRVMAEDGGPCTEVNYDPLVLPSGIEGSDDEILSARSAAYSRSFRLREAEHGQKPTSAVPPGIIGTGGKS